MPDLSFFASNQEKDHCLVAIQSKATAAKLKSGEFDSAIKSTSTSRSNNNHPLAELPLPFWHSQAVYPQGQETHAYHISPKEPALLGLHLPSLLFYYSPV